SREGASEAGASTTRRSGLCQRCVSSLLARQRIHPAKRKILAWNAACFSSPVVTGAMRYVQSGAALAMGAWLLGACGGAFIGNGGDCEHDGASYADGESFPAGDSCNTCSCSDGKVACTRAACSAACVHEGKFYEEGASFAASDGCNTCSCEQAGV